MHKRGRVCAAFGTEGYLRGVPWGIVQLDLGAVVAELLEVVAGRVWDVVDACSQVGLTPDSVYELSPGRRAGKFLA